MHWIVLDLAVAMVAGFTALISNSILAPWLSKFRFPMFRTGRVVLSGGKIEYLGNISDIRDFEDHLRRYISYEITVKDALDSILSDSSTIRYEEGRADFLIEVDNLQLAIEAKTHASLVSPGELKKLKESDGASALILVHPKSDGADQETRDTENDLDGIYKISGDDVNEIEMKIRELIVRIVSKAGASNTSSDSV